MTHLIIMASFSTYAISAAFLSSTIFINYHFNCPFLDIYILCSLQWYIVSLQYCKLILCSLFPHPLEFFYMPVTQLRYYNIRVLTPHLNNSKYLVKFISYSMEFTTFQDLVLSLYHIRLIFCFDLCYPHLHVHLCPNGRASLSMRHSVRDVNHASAVVHFGMWGRPVTHKVDDPKGPESFMGDRSGRLVTEMYCATEALTGRRDPVGAGISSLRVISGLALLHDSKIRNPGLDYREKNICIYVWFSRLL